MDHHSGYGLFGCSESGSMGSQPHPYSLEHSSYNALLDSTGSPELFGLR